MKKKFKPDNWYEKKVIKPILENINKNNMWSSILKMLFFIVPYVLIFGVLEKSGIKIVGLKKILIELISWIPLLMIVPSIFWFFMYYISNFRIIRPEFNIVIMMLLWYSSFKISKFIKEILSENEKKNN